MTTYTFVDELEAVVQDVSSQIAQEIEDVVNTLAPDGRALNQEVKSMDEKLLEYRTIRNDVEAWKLWISQKAMEITGKLQMSGVGPDKIAAVNPLKIAIAYMQQYSAEMEREIEKRML